LLYRVQSMLMRHSSDSWHTRICSNFVGYIAFEDTIISFKIQNHPIPALGLVTPFVS